MTRLKVRTRQQRLTSRTNRGRTLTQEQERALGDLGLIGGPAFIIGLWGLAALVSGLATMVSSLL